MNIFELNHGIQAALSGTPTVWLGDQASFDVVAEVQRQVASLTPAMIAQLEARSGARDADGLPMIWEKRGSNAIINVSGSLIDGAAGYGRYFGVIGYDDICVAAIDAYSDPDVKKVLWKIESPGGQVSGIMDAGTLIKTLSDLKPSMTYTANLMASGGYWLATSITGDIVAGATAEVGSIGVLMVLTDYTKALADAGIKKTVMRAGEDKARVNPFEELTSEARTQLQTKMDAVHSIFRAHVAKGRPNLSTEDLLAATTGKTFLGKQAKSAGLVDKVASFDQALKLLDSYNPSSNTPSNSKGASMKTVLTAAQIAMIAQGVSIDNLGLSAEGVAEVKAEQQRQADEATAAANKVAQDAALAAAASTTAAAAAEAAKKATGATETADATKLAADLGTANTKIDLLNAQLVGAQASLVAKEVELTNLKASTQTMTANHDGMLAGLRTAVGKLQVAMGGSDTAAGLDAATCAAEYLRLDAAFLTKFKPGAASKLATETNTDKPAVADEATRRFQTAARLAQQNRTAK